MKKLPTCSYPIFYDTFDEREQSKAEGWSIVRDRNAPLEARVVAARQVMRAHFHRSVEHAHNERRLRRHPTFDVYLRMLDLGLYRFDADVERRLRTVIGEPILGAIEPGTTYYVASTAPGAKRAPGRRRTAR